MPFTLLAALFLAFALETRQRAATALPAVDLTRGVAVAAAGVAVVGLAAAVLGWWVSRAVAQRGFLSPGARKVYVWGTRAIPALALSAYAATLELGAWRGVVRSLLGGREWSLASDTLLLLPFLLTEAAAWCGLYPAERALRVVRTGMPITLQRHLALKGRQLVGLLLPILLVYSLGQDVASKVSPPSSASPWGQPAGLIAMAALVLVVSPLFLRIAWPTYSLPPGPLRDRLERLAHRVGFRCTDILVWDTGGLLVNAGVTGTLPWFRYVLLSDALVDNLEPDEVAAVFGHEIGHIAHRHLLSFGLFFIASVGVMFLIDGALDRYVLAGFRRLLPARYNSLAIAVEAAAALVVLGSYFFLVFGMVSRQFERQADLFGCRAVSCGQDECPPHRHADAGAPAARVCGAGIRTFVSALSRVAALNGMAPNKPSWRHGSIARRIAFVEGLEGRPDDERRLQHRIVRLRVAIALMLAVAWSWWAYAEAWSKRP